MTVFQPPKAAQKSKIPIVICVHGGSWIFGQESDMHDIASYICTELEVITIAISYRLSVLKLERVVSNIIGAVVCILIVAYLSLQKKEKNNIFIFLIVVIYIVILLSNTNTTTESRHPNHLLDVLACIKYIQQNINTKIKNADPQRIVLLGHSAGAHLVSLAVTNLKFSGIVDVDINCIKGVVAISGVYCRETLLKSVFLYPLDSIVGDGSNDFYPISHISHKTPPFCVIVASGDFSLITHARRFTERLTKYDVKHAYVCSRDSHFSVREGWRGSNQHTGKFVVDFIEQIFK